GRSSIGPFHFFRSFDKIAATLRARVGFRGHPANPVCDSRDFLDTHAGKGESRMTTAARIALVSLAVLLAGILPASAQSMSVDATAASGTNMFFAGHATSGPPAIIIGRTLQNGEMDTTFAAGGLLQLRS